MAIRLLVSAAYLSDQVHHGANLKTNFPVLKNRSDSTNRKPKKRKTKTVKKLMIRPMFPILFMQIVE